jgi:hypothetical protein
MPTLEFLKSLKDGDQVTIKAKRGTFTTSTIVFYEYDEELGRVEVVDAEGAVFMITVDDPLMELSDVVPKAEVDAIEHVVNDALFQLNNWFHTDPFLVNWYFTKISPIEKYAEVNNLFDDYMRRYKDLAVDFVFVTRNREAIITALVEQIKPF